MRPIELYCLSMRYLKISFKLAMSSVSAIKFPSKVSESDILSLFPHFSIGIVRIICSTNLQAGSLIDKSIRVPTLLHAKPVSDIIFSSNTFSIEKAQEKAQELKDLKNKLDDVEIRKWKEHTLSTCITRNIVSKLRTEIGAEMPTKAWAKMYEMLHVYDLIDDLISSSSDNTELNSLHLCEAPGAFICATNHFLKNKFPNIVWQWLGFTLNPYYSGNCGRDIVSCDVFIKETMNNWYFGKNLTGNICDLENITGIWNRAKDMGKVMFVTADGSFDCSGDPNNQESTVVQLHFCEVVTALGVLQEGGAFVLKIFTFFEHSSLGILSLLSSHFHKVWICKPFTSIASNGETYVICKGFKGISNHLLETLLAFTGKNWPCFSNGKQKALIPLGVFHEEGLQSMVAGACYFADLQMQAIKNNLKLFQHISMKQMQQIKMMQTLVSEAWLQCYAVKPIQSYQRVVQQVKITFVNYKRKHPDKDCNISETAKKIMRNMGHEEGRGLGKNCQGITKPLTAIKRPMRSGLS